MSGEFRVGSELNEESEGAKILHPKSGYELYFLYEKKLEHPDFKLHFKIPLDSSTAEPENRKMLVTERDYSAYPLKLRKLFADIWRRGEIVQYVEVGPGLGGFIDYASDYAFDVGAPKPIAIDLVNYSLLGEMLECARNLDLKYLSKNSALGVRVNERFDTLVDRCRIILDSERVCFYNMDIREAVNNVEGLVGCADVVIDNFGPCLYTGTEKNVMKLEKKLSAPWGVFFVNDGKG